jgi:N-methylhydantoinase B
MREVRLLAPGAQLSVLAERSLLRPYGVCAGFSGAPNRFWVRRGTEAVEPSPVPGKVSAFPLEREDIVVMESSGGGGYGDPLERDPALVLADLAEGVITSAVAMDVYGCVITGTTVDGSATETRRRALRASRPRVSLVALDGLDESEVRRIRLPVSVARDLHAGAGDVVEIIDASGAPLRAWVELDAAAVDASAAVSRETLDLLRRPSGGQVEIRSVYSR